MVSFPDELNIAQSFLDARIEEGKGDKTAVLYEDQKLTYNNIKSLSNKFANALTELGIGNEERIIISLPDSPEYVGALFGILKTGAVVVMVNPYLKPEDIVSFIRFTRGKVVMTTSDVAQNILPLTMNISTLKNIVVIGDKVDGTTSWSEISKQASNDFKTVQTHKYDPAIWLFSGGTTGRPKAVVQTHQSFANTTELYGKKTVQYNENDITLSVPKLFFGYATGSNLFFPFSVGATTVLFHERCTAEILTEKIRKFRPTILVNVPTMINNLLRYENATADDFSSLRLSTSAGEALPEALYNKWKERFKVEILDGLGTAEMWHIFISNRPGDVKPGTLGRVVEGFEAKVCDEEGKGVADGEPGYLWIRGGSRAIWYYQRMDLTQKVFIGDWYVSGDLLSMDQEGYFHYEGRADDMMKVSGKWVSPKEVENCLLKHDMVKECAVVGYEEEGLTKPRAFVILKTPAKGDLIKEELKEFVRSNLEPHKYPRDIVFLDEFPRTHYGKVDRKKLKTLS